jgi:hypothetical protein
MTVELSNGITIVPKSDDKVLQFFYEKKNIICVVVYECVSYFIFNKKILTKKNIKSIKIGQKNINLSNYIVKN